MRALLFLFLAVAMSCPRSAAAARPSEIIQKTVILRGEVALAGAKLLGLALDQENSLTLPWTRTSFARNCSWGLPDGREEPGVVRCEDLAVPTNKITFRPGTPSELELSGTWFDAGTGTGPKLANVYFLSPEDGELAGNWSVVRQAYLNYSKGGTRVTTDETQLPYLEVSSHDAGVRTRLMISINSETVRTRNEKIKRNEECLKKYAGFDGSPC